MKKTATYVPNIIDKDPAFTIDSTTRELKNESKKITLMQFDHMSERFRFTIDEMVEGHDMTKCNNIEIHYYITEASTRKKYHGVSVIEPSEGKDKEGNTTTSVIHAVFDENGNYTDKLEFSWLITDSITQRAGVLSFMIHFCHKDTVNGIVTTYYRWCTGINSSINIAASINGGEAIVEQYPDALAQLETKYNNLAFEVTAQLDDKFEALDDEVAAHVDQTEKDLQNYVLNLIDPDENLQLVEFASTADVLGIFGVTEEEYLTTVYNEELVSSDDESLSITE